MWLCKLYNVLQPQVRNFIVINYFLCSNTWEHMDHTLWLWNYRVQRSSLQQQIISKSEYLLDKFWGLCLHPAGWRRAIATLNPMLASPHSLSASPAQPLTRLRTPRLPESPAFQQTDLASAHVHSHRLRNTSVVCKTLMFPSAFYTLGAKKRCPVSSTDTQSILTDRVLRGEYLSGSCNTIVSHYFSLSAEDFGHLTRQKDSD